jgi:GDPmannose 4,6-dehydratase
MKGVHLMANRRAFITGVSGQDGSYLAELLLEKDYEVHGLVRWASSSRMERLEHLVDGPKAEKTRFHLHEGDICDGNLITRLVLELEPDEIYHLAALSHVRVSFDQPAHSVATGAVGTLNVLEAARALLPKKQVRYYQASSSEMFGKVHEVPQRETTPFHPRSPYACAKAFGFWQTVNYREAYGMFASNGILFNHESPRRGETFVTRKVTRAATRIKEGLQEKLTLGNLDARRDWGYAKDYVEAMWLMLQHKEPDDFVVATGETHSVEELVQVSFDRVGLDWRKHVDTDPIFCRPSEVDILLGDATKAQEKLGWKPRTTFRELVELMVDSDWEAAKEERRRLDRV